MKISHFLFVALAAAGLLTGCLSEVEMTPTEQSELIPINVDGSIEQVATKVTAQGFENGDAIGLYAVNYLDQNQKPGILQDYGNQVDHVKYVFDEANHRWIPGHKVYYKDKDTHADLYCYYPFCVPESVSAYNFEVRRDQSKKGTDAELSGYEASDFMWGIAENVVPTEGKVKVRLVHKMSGAVVVLQEGTGFAEGEFAALEKHVLAINTVRKAEIDFATGGVKPIGEAPETGIVMSLQKDGSYQAIIVPQTVAAGKTWFALTIGTKTYRYGQNQDLVYPQGKLNRFTIRISKKENSGEFELHMDKPQIIGWREDNNFHEGTARQYYSVDVKMPGTLGETIKADKKDPAKIRNLYVTGTITESDFYFMRDEMPQLTAVNLREVRIVDVHISNESYWNGEENILLNPEMIVDDYLPENSFHGKSLLYSFVFPENLKGIGQGSFSNTSLTGTIIIPESVTFIGSYAFFDTRISSVELPINLDFIGQSVFEKSEKLHCELFLPQNIRIIGPYAFSCFGFYGKTLSLPNTLEYIGAGAFAHCQFKGNLRIPDKITRLEDAVFYNCGINGSLDLNNVTEIGSHCFYQNHLIGELVLPEEMSIINDGVFYDNRFSKIVLPQNLIKIGTGAFKNNILLNSPVILPEGVIEVKESAFERCYQVPEIHFPASLKIIGNYVFAECYSLRRIVSNSLIPPNSSSGLYANTSTDSFAVEVPAQAVSRYQNDPNWGEFKRITAHYDFTINRYLYRSLKAASSRKFLLRAPAKSSWQVTSKPDWVTVTPDHGTGKTEVVVSVNEMLSTDVMDFERDTTSSTGSVELRQDRGRADKVVFSLEGKNYTVSMDVQQYDYEYADGDVITLQKATKGKGINIVFLGDCYDALDISLGKYMDNIREAYGYLFDIEPYKSYKDYFNVYAVIGMSNDTGIGTVNTIRDAKFGSQYTLTGGISPNEKICYDYAKKADPQLLTGETLVVLVENTDMYGGICYMWGDGSAIAVCPRSREDYPFDFRGLVQHEAGGHGFGKLADEYIYHNAFIQSCGCPCCKHVSEFLASKSLGWSRNLELMGDVSKVGWSHLIFDPRYSDIVDVFEGGFFHARGVYRSEPLSCMDNNIPYFSTISRQAIVERIMKYAGEEFTFEKFAAKDVLEKPRTKSLAVPYREASDMTCSHGNRGYAPVFMGESPEL